MRETNSHGREVISMPRDRTQAVNKLAGLSDIAAKRDWERAAYVALLVENRGRGRPRKNATSSDFQRYTVADFIKIGIYGFRSHAAVDAYLKAWGMSGLPKPEPGSRIEMPATEFPDMPTLYGRTEDDTAPALDPADEDNQDDDTAEGSSAQDEPSPPHPGPSPRPPKPEVTMLDQFLKVLDHADPGAIIHGQPADAVSLLIKTLESWLESLKEAAGEE